jgi:hypothetical protein
MGTIFFASVDLTDSGGQMDTGPSNVAGGHDMWQLDTWQSVDTGHPVPQTEDTGNATRTRLREIRIGQHSDAGDAAAELLGVRIIRYRQVRGKDTGAGTSANGGQRVVPVPKDAWIDTGSRAICTVKVANDRLAQDTGATVGSTAFTIREEIVLSDVWNIAAGWWYYPPEEEMLTLEPGDRMVVRLSAAADPLTLKGTLVYEEGADIL